MVPPSHSRISRYHGWITRRPFRVIVGATLIGLVAAGLATRLKLKTSFAELLPSNDPGVVALTRTQARLGDLSLLLIGIRSPDRDANLRYAEALTQKLRALPPNVVNLATYHVRDVRAFFEQNKWLYVSEADLESIRDRLRTEISKRKNPLFISLGDDDESVESMRAADVEQERPRREVSRRRLHEQGRGRRLRLDRGAAARRTVRRERGRGAAQRGQRPDQGRSAHAIPPGDEGRAGGADRHGHRQPARGRARHHLGDDHLPHHRRDLDRPLLQALACDPADRYPGRDGNGDGVRGGRAGVRLPQLVDGVPGLDHHRQRDQLRDHIDVALRGAPGARQRARRGAALRARRHLARDAGRVDRGVGRVCVADGDELPRLLSVRRDGRDGRAVLLAGDLFDSSGDVDAARPARAERPAFAAHTRRWSSACWPASSSVTPARSPRGSRCSAS